MTPLVRLIFLLLAGSLQAGETCDDPLFRSEAPGASIAARACRVAGEARLRLASCGVVLDQPLRIVIHTDVVGEFGPCLGIYHCGEDRIEVLTPAALAEFRQADGAFGSISDAAFWDSVLVHELTHAAYDKVTCPFPDCTATSEYASYVMQVWSLPEDEQKHFGEDVTLEGRPVADTFSTVMLHMSPARFAKYAWLHFQSRPDPCGYMADIMAGNIFFDRERF